jgi:hypothetical protein
MLRLFLFWLPHLMRLSPKAIFCAAASVGLASLFEIRMVWIAAAGAACGAWMAWHYGMQMVRFLMATWNFRVRASDHVTLRYAPELEDQLDLRHYLELSDELLVEFGRNFGFPLKRRLVVYFFAKHASIRRVFGFSFAGFALVGGDAIGLCADGTVFASLDETIRHELAHLFSARWGGPGLPFKSEGLATWLMSSIKGKPIDLCAREVLLTERDVPLRRLAASSWSYSASSYSVAGSFTGHLIRRFGWDHYRDFYQRADRKNFAIVFARVFGLVLGEAERQWRDELLTQSHAAPPHPAHSPAPLGR